MSRILTEFYNTPWAILPETLAQMSMILHRHAAGVKLTPDEIKAAIGDAPEAAAQRRESARNKSGGGVAVVPLYGVMCHRTKDSVQMSSQLASTETLTRLIRELANDEDISAIVIDVDSPGGSVFGLEELGREIMRARERKKVVAVSNDLMASAAYFVGTAADEIYIAPGGMVGSVGTYTAHQDWSQHLEAEGIKITMISAGEHKTEGNPYEPLSEEAQAEMQRMVDSYYKDFVTAVARHRGIEVSEVEENFGQGRVVRDREAVKRNMADGIATLEEVVAKLQSPAGRRRKRSTTATANRLRLESLK